MKYLMIIGLMMGMMACETVAPHHSREEISVTLTGASKADCIVIGKSQYDEFVAPSVVTIQMPAKSIKIDCRHDDRRRVTTVMALDGVFPVNVDVDFSLVSLGSRYDGFRVANQRTKNISSVLSEKSFNHPVETDQDYSFRQGYLSRYRRSMPVAVQ